MDAHSVRTTLLKVFLVACVALASLLSVFAHEQEEIDTISNSSSGYFKSGEPVTYILVTCIFIALVFFFMIVVDRKYVNKHKKRFFLLIVIPVVLSSFYLAAHTIYKNVSSETGGPVHWHADYQVWACGDRLDLIDPKFPSNKIGAPLFHEHNDDRLHVEGTVMDIDDVSLGRYFETIGGELQDGHLRYVTEDKIYDYQNGDICSDGSIGTLKVYVNGKKIEDYYNYLYYPNLYVPPGDCVIILFDASNEQTTGLLCESWAAKEWNYDSFKRPVVTMGERTWQ